MDEWKEGVSIANSLSFTLFSLFFLSFLSLSFSLSDKKLNFSCVAFTGGSGGDGMMMALVNAIIVK